MHADNAQAWSDGGGSGRPGTAPVVCGYYAAAQGVDASVRSSIQGEVAQTLWQTDGFTTSFEIVMPSAQAQPPVSYTHLRAHETVLDLVCRLLLEKKHNKNRNAVAS